MTTYAIRRILQTIPILFIISILLFFLVRTAPGGPLTAARRNPNITKEQIEVIEEKLGLNDPLPVQYGRWMRHLLMGRRRVPATRRHLRHDEVRQEGALGFRL